MFLTSQRDILVESNAIYKQFSIHQVILHVLTLKTMKRQAFVLDFLEYLHWKDEVYMGNGNMNQVR